MHESARTRVGDDAFKTKSQAGKVLTQLHLAVEGCFTLWVKKYWNIRALRCPFQVDGTMQEHFWTAR